jgi:hypothetical protein
MEMDCIPAGMEIFPAADEEQWEFIKRIIDDCDYYVLIIGGRYGTTTASGISYTEKEYDYAIENNLKVLAFLHEKPDDIPVGKSDIDPELRARLSIFKDKVAKGRLVKFWTSAAELPGLVALSLSKTIKTYPAVGWVRADQVANTELLSELNELRKTNQELQKTISSIQSAPQPVIQNLAKLNDKITLRGSSWHARSGYVNWQHTLNWAELFALLAPYLLQTPNDEYAKMQLTSSLNDIVGGGGSSPTLNDQDFQTAKVQFMALGLVDVQLLQTVKGGMSLFWTLTARGKNLLMELRTVKSPSSK